MWWWVSSTQRTRSLIDAPMMASMWPASSGPGSMTATSSIPTRYVLVPGPVMSRRVRRHDAAHERGQGAGYARRQIGHRSSRATSHSVLIGPRGRTGAMTGGVPNLAVAASTAAVSGKVSRLCSCASVGRIASISPARRRSNTVAGRGPHQVDRLVGVVGRDLSGRRRGHEEAGVEPAGRPRRGDPAGHQVHVGERQVQPFGVEDLGQGRPPGQEVSAPLRQPRRRVAVSGSGELAGGGVGGQQDPALLEALRGPPPPRRPGRRRATPTTPAGVVVGGAGVASRQTLDGVGVVDPPAREDPHAGGEGRVGVTLHHQDLDPAPRRRGVAQQHDRGRRADLGRQQIERRLGAHRCSHAGGGAITPGILGRRAGPSPRGRANGPCTEGETWASGAT